MVDGAKKQGFLANRTDPLQHSSNKMNRRQSLRNHETWPWRSNLGTL